MCPRFLNFSIEKPNSKQNQYSFLNFSFVYYVEYIYVNAKVAILEECQCEQKSGIREKSFCEWEKYTKSFCALFRHIFNNKQHQMKSDFYSQKRGEKENICKDQTKQIEREDCARIGIEWQTQRGLFLLLCSHQLCDGQANWLKGTSGMAVLFDEMFTDSHFCINAIILISLV